MLGSLPLTVKIKAESFCMNSNYCRWLVRELNIPDTGIDLLQTIYERAHYEADLSYGRSAAIYLTRGTNQGDKLSPLPFGIIFNVLLLALNRR